MESAERKKLNVAYFIVIIFINCLGFPGNYEVLFGTALGVLFEYFCFALELILMAAVSSFPKFHIRKSYIPVIAFMLIIFVMSMAVARYKTLEIISCVRFSVTICFALWLAEKYSVTEILKIFTAAQMIFVLLTIVFMIISPKDAFQDTMAAKNALVGLYNTKNTCAAEISTGIILTTLYAKIKFSENRRFDKSLIAFIILQFVLLLLCKATGSLLCTIAILIYIFMFSRFRFNPGWLFIVASAGFIPFAIKVLPLLGKLLELIGKDATLTGRTILWSQVIKVMRSTHTFTGFGYSMFWRNPSAYYLIQKDFNEYSFMGNITSGAHNTLLELWLDIGLIGIAALFVMLIAAMRKVRKTKNNGVYLFVSSYMLLFTFHGLTERSFGAFSYSTLLLFISISLSARLIGNKE